MAKIYTKQALLDPNMLAQDASFRKSLADTEAQNRIASAKAIASGISSFGKGAGETISQGIGMATRYGDFQDILNKYGDDPEAKAAAWKYLYEGDTNPLQSYINTKAAQTETYNQDMARLKSLKGFIETSGISSELKNKYISDYNAIASKYPDVSEYAEDISKPSTTLTTTETIVQDSDKFGDIGTAKNIFANTKWETPEQLEEFANKLRNSGLPYGDVSSLLKEVETKSTTMTKEIESAEAKRKSEEAQAIKSEFDKEVSDVKGMNKGNQKQDLMKQSNAKADELGFPKPFSDNDIKNAGVSSNLQIAKNKYEKSLNNYNAAKYTYENASKEFDAKYPTPKEKNIAKRNNANEWVRLSNAEKKMNELEEQMKNAKTEYQRLGGK